MQKFIVVDKQDHYLGEKSKSEVKRDDIFRISGVMISEGENYLLSQRSLRDSRSPGAWHLSCAGTVEVEETYKTNAIKELTEELGITVDANQLDEIGKTYIHRSDGYKFFFTLFTLFLSKRTVFTINKNEVEKIAWFSKSEILNWFKAKPDEFSDGMNNVLQLLWPEEIISSIH